jgi:hypothetical protein
MPHVTHVFHTTGSTRLKQRFFNNSDSSEIIFHLFLVEDSIIARTRGMPVNDEQKSDS